MPALFAPMVNGQGRYHFHGSSGWADCSACDDKRVVAVKKNRCSG